MAVTLPRASYSGRLHLALPDDQCAALLPPDVQRALVAYGEALTRLNTLRVLIRDGDVKLREAKRADVATRTDAVAAGEADPGDVATARVQQQIASARQAQPVRAELVDRALVQVAELVAAQAPAILERLARDCIEQTRVIAAALDQVEAATIRRDRDRALIDWAEALQQGRQPGKLVAGGPDTIRMFDGLRTGLAGTGGAEYRHLPDGNGHSLRAERAERARAARLEAEGSPTKAEASTVA